MFYLSISLLSAAALGYEVLLMRLFSVALWDHFAATVISLALLGYGVSGTFLTLAQERLGTRFAAVYGAGACLFGAAVPACFAASQRIPFNPLALVWEPGQWFAFAGVYLLLSVPFFFAATCVGLALRRLGDQIPRIYRADLVGAGIGAVVVTGLLFSFRPTTCLRLVACLGFAAAALAAAGRASPARTGRTAWPLVIAIVGSALCFAWPESWIAPRMSPYKGLPRALLAPGAAVREERRSPLGQIAVVDSPQVPLRHAPGLSLSCAAEIPEQLALFSDGEFFGQVTAAAGDTAGQDPPGYLGCLPTALPYTLLRRPRVVVLGSGGGSRILAALRFGAVRVDAVEINPQVVELVRGPLGSFSGHVYDAEGVQVHVAEARSYITSADGEADLIEVSLLDSFGSALAGVHTASVSHLYTVEALEAMLRVLAPGGMLAITLWLDMPPRGSLKLFATAVTALERAGVSNPGERLAWVRTWNTATLLVRNGAFEPSELEAIRAFCRNRSFDLAYLSDIVLGEVNRYNVLDEPYLYQGARAILGDGRDAFHRNYKFFVAPASDDRPYFFRFFKWRTLPELLGARKRGGSPFLEWGYLLIVATFIQSAIAGVALILVPLRRLGSQAMTLRRAGRIGLYFAALGLGFLFVEIAMLHRLILFLGHPVYAAVAVLASFLIFAGLGSGASTRWRRRWAPNGAIAMSALAVACLSLVYLGLLPFLLPRLAGLSLGARSAVAVATVAPLAFFMGMPFPLGLGAVTERTPQWVPWAWGLNGFASVWSATLAALLSIHVGFSGVFAGAAGLYAVAAWAARGWGRGPPANGAAPIRAAASKPRERDRTR